MFEFLLEQQQNTIKNIATDRLPAEQLTCMDWARSGVDCTFQVNGAVFPGGCYEPQGLVAWLQQNGIPHKLLHQHILKSANHSGKQPKLLTNQLSKYWNNNVLLIKNTLTRCVGLFRVVHYSLPTVLIYDIVLWLVEYRRTNYHAHLCSLFE